MYILHNLVHSLTKRECVTLLIIQLDRSTQKQWKTRLPINQMQTTREQDKHGMRRDRLPGE